MMQDWFLDAKLGIFLHWGLYAVNGIPESWSFYRGSIRYADYLKQAEGFTAANYDPHAWTDLFKRAGARYAVLTTKHHDGVALWDTALSDLSVVKKTPAGRDLIQPYADAMRQAGLKIGFYFSHLDWSHPDYAPDSPGCSADLDHAEYDAWVTGAGAEQWARFLKFHRGQLEELSTRYGPVDLFWFDGDWSPSADHWKMDEVRDLLRQWQPDTVLNGRMRGMGDYATPEQGLPVIRPDGPWEYCMTVNDSWGYRNGDDNHKSAARIIRIFCEVIGGGGNLLLAIGPYEDGTFQPEQVERLEVLGEWIDKHQEAVYGTVAGLPPEHHYGPSTLSKDRKTLYVMVFDIPREPVTLKGIASGVERVTVLGKDMALNYTSEGGAPWMNPPVPGALRITVPVAALDPYVTVLKLELDRPLALYRGAGVSIEAN